MTREQMQAFILPLIRGRGLSLGDVVSVMLTVEGIEVEYCVRDYQGYLMVNQLNPDEIHTAFSYFEYSR